MDRLPVIVWTPLLAAHAAVVLLAVLLDAAFGSGLCELVLVVAGLPWSGLALPAYGARFAVLLWGVALGNVVLHAWWVAHEDAPG